MMQTLIRHSESETGHELADLQHQQIEPSLGAGDSHDYGDSHESPNALKLSVLGKLPECP